MSDSEKQEAEQAHPEPRRSGEVRFKDGEKDEKEVEHTQAPERIPDGEREKRPSSSNATSKNPTGILKPGGPRKPSPFQRLEDQSHIFARIFFLSGLNYNFPAASPFIAKFLSGERIFRALTLLAFWEEDEPWPGNSRPWLEEIFEKLIRVKDADLTCYQNLTAKRDLQWQVMKRRWFNLDRVRILRTEAMHVFVDNMTWFREKIQIAPIQQKGIQRLIGSSPKEGEEMRTFYAREHYGEWLRIHVQETSPVFDVEIRSQFFRHRLRYPGHLLAIPDNRLCGTPWTPQKVAFLSDLRRMFAIQDCLALAMSRQAVHQGIVTALNRGNLEALEIILKYNVVAYYKERLE
ncbi:hypothetical protein KEM55_007734, partial [Ascosphaera atra]